MERARARAWQAGGAQGGGGTFFISSRVRQQRRCRARGGGPQGQISPPSCKMQVGTGRGGPGERELGGTVFPRPSVSPKSLGVPLCVQPRWGSGRFLPKSLGCWTRQHFRTLTPPDGHPDHGEPAASFPPWVLEQHVANVSGLFSCPTQQPGRRLSRNGEKGRLGGGRPRRVGAASRKRQASAPEGRARGLLSFPRVPMVLGAADCGLATAPSRNLPAGSEGLSVPQRKSLGCRAWSVVVEGCGLSPIPPPRTALRACALQRCLSKAKNPANL